MGWDRFLQYIQFNVGSGSQLRFWQDHWYGDQPLRVAFPTLYDSSIVRHASVEALFVRWNEKKRSWNVRFFQTFND